MWVEIFSIFDQKASKLCKSHDSGNPRRYSPGISAVSLVYCLTPRNVYILGRKFYWLSLWKPSRNMMTVVLAKTKFGAGT